MDNGTLAGNYVQTTVTAPTTPSTTSTFGPELNFPLIRELVASRIIEEPTMMTEMTSARSFFNGETLIQANELLANIKYGQKLKVNIEKDQNPLSLTNKSALTYSEVDSCHDHLNLNCSMDCLNTLPQFQYIEVCFDTRYAFGVRYCDKDRDFWNFEYVAKQYAKSKRAYEFRREIDLWNVAVQSAIASPATTVDYLVAQSHPTHYWSNLGTLKAAGRKEITHAYQYMVNAYAGINPTIFMTAEAAQEIIAAEETLYARNNLHSRVNTYKEWTVPGFLAADAVSEILGIVGTVVIMKRSPWLTYTNGGTTTNLFPLWSTDTTKQYVALFDPRYAYSFEKKGYVLNIRPYDCDKLLAGTQEEVYVAMGKTFPQYALLLEFSQWNHTTYLG